MEFQSQLPIRLSHLLFNIPTWVDYFGTKKLVWMCLWLRCMEIQFSLFAFTLGVWFEVWGNENSIFTAPVHLWEATITATFCQIKDMTMLSLVGGLLPYSHSGLQFVLKIGHVRLCLSLGLQLCYRPSENICASHNLSLWNSHWNFPFGKIHRT